MLRRPPRSTRTAPLFPSTTLFRSEYGSRVSPRLSLLYKPSRWTVRASVGHGFYAPTPFVEEIEETGLSRLEPLGTLRAATAATAAVDVGYKAGPLEATVALFGTTFRPAGRLDDAGSDRGNLCKVAGDKKGRSA